MKKKGFKHLISKPLATFWLVSLLFALGLQFSASLSSQAKKSPEGAHPDAELVFTPSGTSHSTPVLPEIKISEPWLPTLVPNWCQKTDLIRQPGFVFHPLQKWELKRLLMTTISINAP